MADEVSFKFSAAAAPYLGSGAAREKRLEAAAGRTGLAAAEQALLVYCLCHDPDPEVQSRAKQGMRNFDLDFLLLALADPQLHPRLLDVLVQLYFRHKELAPLFANHLNLSDRAAAFLTEKGVLPLSAEAAEAEIEEVHLSKYQLSQTMGVSDKIKMALTGDKEWRSLLIKDSNKLVSGSVIKNPRITEGEVLTIAKSAVQNDEIMRLICANKEWLKNYQIKKALVENHKTPLPAALRFCSALTEKDLSALAKSKNVSSVISSQARRMLMSKNK